MGGGEGRERGEGAGRMWFFEKNTTYVQVISVREKNNPQSMKLD